MRHKAPPSVANLSPQKGLRILWLLRKGARALPQALEVLRAELGDVFVIKLGKFERVVIAHPEGLREALVEKREAFAWRVGDEPIVRLLRRGLLVQDGREHLELRKILEPSNRRRHFLPKLSELYPLILPLFDGWRDGEVYDMLVEMRKVALIAFEWVYFSHDVRSELPQIWKPILSVIKYIGPGLWLLWGASAPPAAVRVIDAHLYTLIQMRKRETTSPEDMLTHLVRELSEDDLIRDQMLTMLIAGHDTSTASLAWALHLLSIYPEWQERLHEEVKGAFGSSLPNPLKVTELPFLDAFVKETLRLYPPIHAGNRLVRFPVEIMGYSLRPSQKVLLSYYLVQRHPDFWGEAETFRPERWLEPEGKQNTFAYVPFSGGPRMCIGAPFAQVELRMILAYLIQTFRFLPTSPVQMHMGATLEPYPAVKLKVYRR